MRRKDTVWAFVLTLVSLVLYVATAAPTVATVFDDSLEFQVVLPTAGIAHPSGYPLYTMGGFVASKVIPFRDPAGRVNLLSALAAAVTVGVFYLVARRVAGNRAAAIIAAVALMISPVWWSQATIAEVYALHGLFSVLFLLLILKWEEGVMQTGAHAPDDRYLVIAALVFGLALAHHRLIALLVPATLVFLFWTDPNLLRQPARWVKPLAAALLPLLLYLYLPIRGQTTSSLDGTYVPTLRGTLDWVLASDYRIFLTGNPFNIQRGPGDYVALFLQQFGALLILAAFLGVLSGWRFSRRRWAFLLIATITQIVFGMAYKVQDIGVFFIPAFILVALWAAWGLTSLIDGLSVWGVGQARSLRLPSSARPFVLGAAILFTALVFLFEPVQSAVSGFDEMDRSADWAVYDAGADALMNAVAPGGRVVGLLGETTLLRYFRDVLRARPDVAVTPADSEEARFAAIERGLAAGEPVYITRDLPGAAARYSLDASGPLIAVSPKAQPAPAPDGEPIGASVMMTNLTIEGHQTHAGPVIRVSPVWTTSAPIGEELKISARLLDAGGQVIVADDRIPVHFAYPTTAWVPGELVQDVYDLPIPPGAPGGPYSIQLILYRAADGSELGRVQRPISP